ncbi:SDR family oxidoreductase [Bradyrhizobium sp. 153]|uniref:SDR family NAD(P)-dependent oxidoreductase n=1 Tax=Bradyrhizobium sp. 153 TaxID=2782627 RepID=UPI001FFC0A2D|nr:SDR family oxidoreductase [Bradyrhizobium sp. 153]MCK1666320.1 SDR family oxidoreductase [Bradyrhizobium sp. 153]
MIRLLEEKVALVTGGSQGIGKAICEAFAAHGPKVIVVEIKIAAAEALAASLNEVGGTAFAFPLDVSELASCEALASRIRNEIGAVSILVNNAGVAGSAALDADDARKVWDNEISVNLTGAFNLTRAFLSALKETRGCVVNLCSIASFNAVTAGFGYNATKVGLRSLTQTMARQLAIKGIRANAVAPGCIKTPMTAGRLADATRAAKILSRVPMSRPAAPDEVADPIVFLCSDMARYITGVTLPVDGGFNAV